MEETQLDWTNFQDQNQQWTIIVNPLYYMNYFAMVAESHVTNWSLYAIEGKVWI